MKIHHHVSDGTQAVAITQSASSGGGYAHPVKLSAIRFDVKDAETVLNELNKSGHRHEKSFEVLERWDVDARNQGPNSKFGRTLTALVDEARDHLKGAVTLQAEGMEEGTMAALKAMTKQVKLSQALPKVSAPSMVIGGQVWNPREEAQKESPVATPEIVKQSMRL